MAGFEDTHWAATQKQIDEFRKLLRGKGDAEQSALAAAEVAEQLMHMNSHLEELTKAIWQIADSK